MFPITRFRVEDQSMEPTLSPGDYVLVNRWASRFSKGDLVVLRDPEGASSVLVKRVADITTSGACFVVGDNATASRDSRAFGAVPRDLIVGRVWRQVRP